MGFTLLEVLIALVIFAVTSVMLYQQVGRSALVLESLEERSKALLIIKNEYSQLLIDRKLLPLGEKSKTIEMSGRDWGLKTTVEKAPNLNLRQVTLDVYNKEDGEEYTILSLTRFIGRY